MFWNKRRRGKPLPVNEAGRTTVTVSGTPFVGLDASVAVTADGNLTFATVENNAWFDKVLILQTPHLPVQTEWNGIAIGLGPEQAQKLAAALLGLTDADVVAVPAAE